MRASFKLNIPINILFHHRIWYYMKALFKEFYLKRSLEFRGGNKPILGILLSWLIYQNFVLTQLILFIHSTHRKSWPGAAGAWKVPRGSRPSTLAASPAAPHPWSGPGGLGDAQTQADSRGEGVRADGGVPGGQWILSGRQTVRQVLCLPVSDHRAYELCRLLGSNHLPAFYRDGVPTERLCADGMVFNDYSPIEEKCDLPYNIDCSKRSQLREYPAESA